MPSPETILSLRDVCAWYGDSQALHGVSLDIHKGEVVSLIGRNGAGKTTCLKAIMGLTTRRSGTIALNGSHIEKLQPEKIAWKGIAYCPEERGIYSSLTVHENLMLPPVVAEGGFSAEAVYEMFPNLQERKNNQGTKLSGGEQQMLAIGRILRTGARVLLLDEPTEGLAPVIVLKIGQIIQLLKDRGYTILLVEQNFHFVSNLADRNYVMGNGKIVDLFNREELSRNIPKVKSYLGI